jgi:hypothetical protein
VIELLALDLDGTLIGEEMVIADLVRHSVLEAQKRGVIVTLATGRMFDAAVPFARDLGIEAPLICYQGGLIQASEASSPLYRATMTPDVIREVLRWRANSADRNWHMVLYADDALFIVEQRYPESFYRDLLGPNLRCTDDFRSVLAHHDPVKFIFVAECVEADRIEAAMRRRFKGRMEIVRSHANFVEGNPLGVSKGNALRRLAQHLEISQERVMSIGDQGNDVSMIRWAGVGVAMGNASAEAKGVADWIAPPFAEHGVAVAIQRFILNALPSS